MNEEERKVIFDAMIRYGREALRASMFMNGGASLALLTFIGTVWSKNGGRDELDPLAYTLAAFSLGVLFAGVASAAAYRTQYYQNERANTEKHEEQLYFHRKLRVSRMLAVWLVYSSFFLFFLGILASFLAFTSRFPSCL